ncbi:oligomeric Golgi complex subunit 6 [Blastocladiella britannica]|nr:oligomeric Golgi complex subunit 6 [Blastocladiella britannica]
MDALTALQQTLAAPLFTAAASQPSVLSLSQPSLRSAGFADALATYDRLYSSGPLKPVTDQHLRQRLLDDEYAALDDLIHAADVVVSGPMATVTKQLDDLHVAATALLHGVADARSDAADFVRVAVEHARETDSLAAEQRTLADFLATITLTPAETALLTSPSSSSSPDLSDAFFAALDRVAGMDRIARDQLGYPDSPLGRDVVQSAATMLDAGCDQLYRWLQGRLVTLSGVSPDISPSVPRALACLAQYRPAYRDAWLEDAVAHRRTAIARWFVETSAASASSAAAGANGSRRGSTASSIRRGSTAGSAASLISSTTPPRSDRELADVLAWVHQAVAGDLALWTLDIGNAVVGGRGTSVALVDAAVCGGIGGMVRDRVEQVLARSSGRREDDGDGGDDEDEKDPGDPRADVAAAYRAYYSLGVHATMLAKSLSPAAELVNVLAFLQQTALHYFRDALDRNAVATLAAARDPSRGPPPDAAALDPTPAIGAAIAAIRAVAAAHAQFAPPPPAPHSSSSSPSSPTSPSPLPPPTTDPMPPALIDLLVDPAVQAAVVVAEQLGGDRGALGGGRAAKAVFVVNCLTGIKEAIAPISAEKALAVETQIDMYLEALGGEYYSGLVSQSGMSELLTQLQHSSSSSSSSSSQNPSLVDHGVTPRALQNAFLSLDAMLMTGIHSDASRALSKLVRGDLARDAVGRGTKAFVAAYAKVVAAVMDDPRCAEAYANVAVRSAAEVAGLLRV